MADTVLVSGGSGDIAGFLIRQLIGEGWSVHTTVRNQSAAHAKAVLSWALLPEEQSIVERARCLIALNIVRA